MGGMKSVAAYRELREELDRACEGLAAMHAGHMGCRAGCSSCCTNLSVFPVEYDVILHDLQRDGQQGMGFDLQQPCGFLKDGLCTLYAYRPIICRTHGLPVAFTNETFDPPEVNVSFCPMNFADVDLDQYEFGPQNTLDLDRLNERLREINDLYLMELPQSSQPPERVPLSQLAKDLHGYTRMVSSLL